MGRNLSPILRQELQNLDKDADSRKSAMKALKSYVKELDSKAIPLFLAQVSESKETSSSFGEYTISLYEVLARIHGQKIVPQIDNIMDSIIKTLASSAGSFALHQACSKVVPAIARYGIDPTTPEDKKRHVIHSLCKPLSYSLLGSQENLSSGAALCLKALVDSDNWRFASNEMVNEVCQRVSGALDKHTQVGSHLGLVMALSKHNSLIVEAYARLLIQSGLHILNVGVDEGNSQKRFSAIQMVNFLMKCLDPKSILSELECIIEEMEKCQSDPMAFVKGAAFETLQTARKIITEMGSKCEIDVGAISRFNNGKMESRRRRNLWGAGDQSPHAASPESQSVNSFAAFNCSVESPISVSQASCDLIYDESVNRKLWSRYENGGVDVSLRDGLFSEVTRGDTSETFEYDEFSDNQGGQKVEFAGFLQRSHVNRVVTCKTPRPQDPNGFNPDFSSHKQARMYRSPSVCKFECSPKLKSNQSSSITEVNHETRRNKNLYMGGDQEFHGSSESVSSTEYAPAPALAGADLVSEKLASGSETQMDRPAIQNRINSFANVVYGLFVLLITFLVGFMWIGEGDEGYNFVPT